MGFDCGFDIYPPLEATASNKETYRRFLDEIIRTYENVYDKEGRRTDGKVLEVPTNSDDKIYISLTVGECPHMPHNPDHCDYFLRFSSKVSGHLTTPADPYIRNVHKIAKKYFSSRVHFWHELCETGDERQWGYYNWLEVHEADRKLRELERQEQGLQEHALEERVGKTNEPNLNVDLSDLMKSISLGNEIDDGAQGKNVSRPPNHEPTMSVNVSNLGGAVKIQFDETSASPAEVAVIKQIMAVALSPRTRSISWEGNLLGLVAFDALHAALQVAGIQVQVDFKVAWAHHLTGPEIAKFVLDCDESKTPVSAEVQKQLQDMAAVALNNMPKLTSGMRSDREYLVHVLQVMRLRKDGDETFKSLIDRGIEVARGGKLVTVGETNGDGKADEREE
jgi:hypothetical protein